MASNLETSLSHVLLNENPLYFLQTKTSTSNSAYRLNGTDVIVVLRNNEQDQNLVNESTIIRWLQLVWFPSIDQSQPSLLMMDSFDPHTTPSVRNLMGKHGTAASLALSPVACAAFTQPILRGTKHRFKVCMLTYLIFPLFFFSCENKRGEKFSLLWP